MINLVSKTKNKIHEYIPDFKKFMDIEFFPDFKIDVFPESGNLNVTYENDISFTYLPAIKMSLI